MLHPVRLPDGGVNGKVVVSMWIHLWQSGQGWQLGSHEIRDTLHECPVVKVPFDARIAKIAVHENLVDVVLVAGCYV